MSERKSTGRTDLIKEAFEGLDQESLDLLRDLAEMQVFPPNSTLVREGEVADRMFVINRGRVVITQAVGKDEERVLAMRGSGGYFGEMALITDQTRSATIKTIVETEVMIVTKEVFDQVFLTSPNLARSLLQTMIVNIREADQSAIRDLLARHEELQVAYEELRAAQAEIVAKERMERELEIAGEVQRSLLPDDLPQVPNFEFAVRFDPARQVGGDFFDVMMLPDGQVAVLLADVSDKGAHAALFMAVTRTLFRTEARRQLDPAEVVRGVHDGLIDVSTSEMFVTAVYGVLDTSSGLFRYVRAGHDEPLWVAADGSTAFLGGKGRFLGMWPAPPVEEEQLLQFQPGDCLVIYSDGVTDMTNAKDEPFGAGGLENIVVKHHHQDAEAIAQAIFDAVQTHRGDTDAFDDVTLVVVRAV
jgi:serine phosphatase RsbU (regulator of sigma subunit)